MRYIIHILILVALAGCGASVQYGNEIELIRRIQVVTCQDEVRGETLVLSRQTFNPHSEFTESAQWITDAAFVLGEGEAFDLVSLLSWYLSGSELSLDDYLRQEESLKDTYFDAQ